MSTRWSSAFSDPQWLSLDMGASKNINRIVLHWENAASAHYDVQVSSAASGSSGAYNYIEGESDDDQPRPEHNADVGSTKCNQCSDRARRGDGSSNG